jgi:hypothetical protein
LIVSFRLPETRMWIDAEATVARVVHGRRLGDPGRALGVSFGAIDRKSRSVLRATLLGVPPPIPMRDRRIDYAATITQVMQPLLNPGTA